MGENIGTTITAWLASLGTTTTAKRAAYAHVFFNVFGTVWFVAMFPIVIKGVSQLIGWKTGGNPLEIGIGSMDEDKFGQIITAGIALTHTSFNVANVIVFLPFAGLLGKFVTFLVPDKKTKEVSHLTYLDVRMLDTPALSIVQSLQQINFMGASVATMMTHLRACLESERLDAEISREIFHREEILDNVQKEIFVFLSNLVSGQVPHDVTKKAHMQMRIADEYETISDYAASVLKGIKKLEEMGLPLDGPARKKLTALHDRVAAYILNVNEYVKEEQAKDILAEVTSEGASISALMKEFRRQHLERLQKEEVSPFFSLAFTDILNYYRRMKDHALNIAEVIAGEK
jgi:phosphate:Na+ symporter